jgi:hypothetical protein
VLDPFIGSGTVALAAEQYGRDWLGIEINSAFARMAEERLRTARQPRRRTAAVHCRTAGPRPVASVPLFLLGTHQPGWLASAKVPLFISDRRLSAYRNLPCAVRPWALDSGAFSELAIHGNWDHGPSPRQYVDRVRRYQREIGKLLRAASQDWMCEPFILAKTGLTVAAHQARTVASYLELRSLAPDLPWTPVLQGWRPDDYRRHLDAYDRAGVDLRALPVVGLGSVCRRQHTTEVEDLVRSLSRLGLQLHGFGFKVQGLARLGGVLRSADSMAWSFEARRLRRPACGSAAHRNCANCLAYALAWRERVLAAGAAGVVQPSFWSLGWAS